MQKTPPYRKGTHWSCEQHIKFIESLPQGHAYNWKGGLSDRWRIDICKIESAIEKPIPCKSEIHHYPTKRECTNLVLCENRVYHYFLHTRQRALLGCGNVNYRKCQFCGQWDDPSNLYIHPKYIRHVTCFNKYQANRKEKKS